jgi:hypothetical protein
MKIFLCLHLTLIKENLRKSIFFCIDFLKRNFCSTFFFKSIETPKSSHFSFETNFQPQKSCFHGRRSDAKFHLFERRNKKFQTIFQLFPLESDLLNSIHRRKIKAHI